VTNIGDYSFQDASSLTSIIFAANSKVASIGQQSFQNTARLTSITIPASINNIGSYAFLGSGLTTVIFESTINLESLGFKISNAPQNFYGQMVFISPTKAAVQSALSDAIIAASFAQGKIEQLTSAVTIAEISRNTAQREYEQAEQNLVSAQTTLQNSGPQYLEEWIFDFQNPAYTTAYNNVVTATATLALAQLKSNTANAQLTIAQENLKNATAQVTTANDLVTKLRAAQSWAV
jgi:hypothetical protein